MQLFPSTNTVTRFILTLAAVVLAANAIAGSCYVRKACLTLTNDPTLCNYKV